MQSNRGVATATVGFMALALSGWMMSMSSAGWYASLFPHALALAYSLGLTLVIMGILSFVDQRALDAIIFFGGAGLLGAFYTLASPGMQNASEPSSYVGWFHFIWAVFFCWVWFGSFRAGVPRFLFLLGLWLTLLAWAIGYWGQVHGFIILGGYIGLITSILAAITSAMTIITRGWQGDPNVQKSNA